MKRQTKENKEKQCGNCQHYDPTDCWCRLTPRTHHTIGIPLKQSNKACFFHTTEKDRFYEDAIQWRQSLNKELYEELQA